MEEKREREKRILRNLTKFPSVIVIGEESIKNKEPREKKRKRLHDSSNEEKWPGETGHFSRSEPKPRRGNISVEETELANYRGIEINADRFRGNLWWISPQVAALSQKLTATSLFGLLLVSFSSRHRWKRNGVGWKK